MRTMAQFFEKYDKISSPQCIWDLLLDTTSVASKVRRRELLKYNISPNKAGVLASIKYLNNNASPAQMSRWLFKEPQSVSGILNRMEKEGIIIKKVDSKRKNVLRISLTPKGEEIYANLDPRISIDKITACLSNEDCKQLINLLKKFQKKVLEVLEQQQMY